MTKRRFQIENTGQDIVLRTPQDTQTFDIRDVGILGIAAFLDAFGRFAFGESVMDDISITVSMCRAQEEAERMERERADVGRADTSR